jgi:hypothetical protein
MASAPRPAFTKAKTAQARAWKRRDLEKGASRGFTLLLDWDFLQAEQSLRHALELNPDMRPHNGSVCARFDGAAGQS